MFKIRDGFKVWTSPGGMVLVGLESGRLDACLRYVADSAAGGVVVSRYHGFDESHLDCLLTCRSMQGLYVVDAWPDLSPIEHLDHLEWLQVGGSSSAQPFELSSFPKLKVLRANWWPDLVFEGAAPCLVDVYLSDFRPVSRDCTTLTPLRNLRKLELCGSNVQSFHGLEGLTALEQLIAIECRTLRDTSALRGARANLKHLSLGHCRKIDPVLDVRMLTHLESLSYYACADIPSLSFLDELPNLTHLRFVKTQIVDGDLRPVLRLLDVNFENIRGLSHTYDEVRGIIAGLPS